MAILTESLTVDIVLALLSAIFLGYWYLTGNSDYWQKRGVRSVNTWFILRFLRGNKTLYSTLSETYDFFRDENYGGLFLATKPVLMIRDPDLIHHVLVKDFSHFQDRGNPEIKDDPMLSHLFNLTGNTWRNLRYKLTGTFTTGKLRAMFQQVASCGINMLERTKRLSRDGKSPTIDTRELATSFTLNVVSSCAFGMEITPDTQQFSDFQTAVNVISEASLATLLRIGFGMSFPNLAYKLNLRPFPAHAYDYFLNLVRATVKYRADNRCVRNDYMQLLLSLKEQEESGKSMLTMNDTSDDDTVILDQMKYDKSSNQMSSDTKLFSEEFLCANSVIFLAAGSDTTANVISFTLFELSKNPRVQLRLQQEVDKVLAAHGNYWSYDGLRDMSYLSQVVQESLRMYPFLHFLQRECTKSYKVPDSDLVIDKGTLIIIPLGAIQMDPLHYRDPQRFDPDRFEGNNFKPSPIFLPFGDGPRMCIAMRFAVMEVKSCIAYIMSKYSVRLSPETILPLQYQPRSFTQVVKNGIWLTFHKRVVI